MRLQKADNKTKWQTDTQTDKQSGNCESSALRYAKSLFGLGIMRACACVLMTLLLPCCMHKIFMRREICNTQQQQQQQKNCSHTANDASRETFRTQMKLRTTENIKKNRKEE